MEVGITRLLEEERPSRGSRFGLVVGERAGGATHSDPTGPWARCSGSLRAVRPVAQVGRVTSGIPVVLDAAPLRGCRASRGRRAIVGYRTLCGAPTVGASQAKGLQGFKGSPGGRCVYIRRY